MADIENIDDHRKKSVCITSMPDIESEWPSGPFTVTISDADGVMWQATFPDSTGVLPPDAIVRGTGGIKFGHALLANILSGAIRAFMGSR
jgi:hypothetical protein